MAEDASSGSLHSAPEVFVVTASWRSGRDDRVEEISSNERFRVMRDFDQQAGGRSLKFAILGTLLLLPCLLHAETGAEGWLRYAPLEKAERAKYAGLPAIVVMAGDSPLIHSAQQEMIRGVSGMLGRTLGEVRGRAQEPSIVLGTVANLRAVG